MLTRKSGLIQSININHENNNTVIIKIEKCYYITFILLIFQSVRFLFEEDSMISCGGKEKNM